MRPDTRLHADFPGSGPPVHKATDTRITARIPGTHVGVRCFLERLDISLTDLAPVPELRDLLELVLAEVLNNIVEHAYHDRKDGEIGVTVTQTGDRLIVDVTDDGIAMPEGRLPEKRAADVDVPRDDLPEGGFGWFLIHELVEELAYTRRKGQNHVQFAIRPG